MDCARSYSPARKLKNLITNIDQTLSRWAGIELDEFLALKAWEERMLARPAVEKGRQIPGKHQREMLQGECCAAATWKVVLMIRPDPKAMAEFEERAKAFYRAREKEAAEAVVDEQQ